MIRVKCHYCGHEWDHKGKAMIRYIACEECDMQVPNPRLSRKQMCAGTRFQNLTQTIGKTKMFLNDLTKSGSPIELTPHEFDVLVRYFERDAVHAPSEEDVLGVFEKIENVYTTLTDVKWVLLTLRESTR